MDQLKPPEGLKMDGNLSENWRKWYQRFQLYLTASGIDKKDEKIQTATFLHVIGTDALEVFNTFKFDNEGDQEKMEPVTDKFQQYCNPRKNVTFERHVFFTRNQQAVETIDQYVTELRTRATTCEFGDLCDSLIKDRLVCGVRDETIRARLLRDSDLNLKKAIDICRASEMSASRLKSLTSEDDKSVHVVKQKQTGGGPSQSAHTGKSQCQKCGKDHLRNDCPAYGKTCNKCKKLNHFAMMCRTDLNKNNGRVQTQGQPKYNTRYKNPDRKGKVQVIDTHDDTEDLFIGTVRVDKVSTESVTNNDEWFVNLRLKNKSVKFKIDTGAQCNVISKKDYIAAGGKTVSRKNVKKLYTLTGERIQTVGRAMVQCEYKNRYYVLDCHVVEQDVTPVIGLLSCQELNLVKKVDPVSTETKQNTDILKEYSDVFSGLQGSFYKHHIEIDPTVKPVVHPPRKVPLAVHDQVKQELDRMEKLGVVEKVHEPTDWVNSMVVVKKSNNKLRICIDPKDMNKAIKREHFPMKTIDVTAKVANAKYFSKLDAESGFWQIELDEPSSNLCTFNTPFGRYKFLRVPFGLSSAPEVFQRAMSEVFKDLDGVEPIVDDILIWGETREQHDARLRSALETARKANVKLDKSKCQIAATELNYIGHTLSAQGLKPDAEKVKAIQEMPDPEDKAGLMRFIGMVQYVAKFIPNLAEVSAPLRQLLENDVCWDWGQSQQNSYKRLKDLVSEAPVLKFYDVKQPVTMSVDASSTGLGAVLLQNNQPVAYASKSLTTAQKHYAQIEKEMLAIVFGTSKFHQYIYGKKVSVQTDHKPLEIIVRKPLYLAPTRLQKMLLKIQPYDLDIKYVPGKELHVADALSRAHLPEVGDTTKLEDDYEVLSVSAVSDEKFNKISKETEKDPSLKIVKSLILLGWPDNRSDVPSPALDYWNFRDELSVRNGVILKGERPVIPSAMRCEMLEKNHESHLGVEKCRQRASDVIFWPKMSKDISDVVSRCAICQENRMSKPKEPLIPHGVPLRPWSKVGGDLCQIDGDHFLVLVDYYSEFFEVSKLKDTRSETVIINCKSQFARHGIPELLITDNGPQFDCREFQRFTKEFGFEHRTSSPMFPQSNGMAEKAVQTVKKLLKKAKQDGRDPYLALLDHRNTPRDSNLGSPAQRLMSRRTKTLLPTSETLLKPELVVNVKENLESKRLLQKHYHDIGAREATPFEIGQNVRVRIKPGNSPWIPGRVVAKDSAPRSYIVNSQGRAYRRNSNHILRSKEHFTKKQLDVNPQVKHHEYQLDIPNSSEIQPELYREDLDHPKNLSQESSKPAVPAKTSTGRVIKKP
ncbi:uncharacterized protein K02A2.6-like [Ylistrum balloti]|uniref:uncharacterized protein K02A2.6-like n=1 Tax=Ylistrum balloti TaxID=509963 RepID=UPI00290586B7|nr:uncharacterized protein K02A2.6-like [Ylistrum balloti]